MMCVDHYEIKSPIYMTFIEKNEWVDLVARFEVYLIYKSYV